MVIHNSQCIMHNEGRMVVGLELGIFLTLNSIDSRMHFKVGRLLD